MSSAAFSAPTSTTSTSTPSTASTPAAEKPKPCCVCQPEKTARDDCMLFSTSDNPQDGECKDLVERYKGCMASYGFKV